MSVTLLHQKVKDGRLEEAEAAVRDWFAILDREHPEGLRYASTRIADSSTFVILSELAEGAPDPRTSIPEFAAFQALIRELADGPPVIERLEVVGSYNLFEPTRREQAVR